VSAEKQRERPRKVRLDELLVLRGLAENRSQAQRLILAGEVSVGDRMIDKAGFPVPDDAEVRVAAPLRYVSRGGLKLEHALDTWAISPEGWICADVGASTGGFTDCLLQRGAARVYAIDVGYGQLAWSLRQDPRVVVLERANIRHLEDLPEPVALAVIDVSFIGLGLVLPRVAALLGPEGQVIALIKPQFEVGKGQVGKGGVVREPELHRFAIEKVLGEASSLGLAPAGLTRSPITGPAGNVEFLAHLRRGAELPDAAEVDRWLIDVLPTRARQEK
jgi:23S rRNA (cytidine1920-2'-O)/16S rRNA (cytidine1409-2'-O)-methyltransferase